MNEWMNELSPAQRSSEVAPRELGAGRWEMGDGSWELGTGSQQPGEMGTQG